MIKRKGKQMTLRDIFNAVGNKRKFWVKFDWDWIEDAAGNIVPITNVRRHLDSEVSVHYQWFHHMNKNIDTDAIYNAIEILDYTTFAKWFVKLKHEELVYLPTDAQIWINNEYIGSVVVAYDEATFKLITSQDYECG
jgi:hypothetical protein